MGSNVMVPVFSLILLAGCMVAPNREGGLTVIPILPAVVEIDSDDYYRHGGYHYFYTDDRWYYFILEGWPTQRTAQVPLAEETTAVAMAAHAEGAAPGWTEGR